MNATEQAITTNRLEPSTETAHATLYLDECGERTWPPPRGNSNTRYFVHVGPILDPGQDLRAHQRLEDILEEFFPNSTKRPDELHYGDIINERGPYEAWTGERKKEISDRVFQVILDLDPVLMGTIIDKKWLLERYGSRAHRPDRLATRSTLDRFHQELDAAGAAGSVVVDSYGQADELRGIVTAGRRGGIKLSKNATADHNLSRILNTVTLAPSEECPGVQLADFVAYATWSHRERDKSRRFEQIKDLWINGHGFNEPSVVPTSSKPRRPKPRRRR